MAGKLIAQAGRTNEAIIFLKDGITKVPADRGLVDLYYITGELLNKRIEGMTPSYYFKTA